MAKKEEKKEEAKTNTRTRTKGAGRQMPNMPPIDAIRQLAKTTFGNKSKVAEALGVTRYRLLMWEKENPEIGEIFREQWDKRLDVYLDTAHLLAVGQTEKDENGRMVYVVPPDPNMVRFMIEKYGKMAGFGQEVSVNVSGEMSVGVPISKWIADNTE
nr:MAG TPA: Sf6 terminase small subunit gp1, octamer, DNA-binding, CAPS buffer.65A [Caudoviricetes sp.]